MFFIYTMIEILFIILFSFCSSCVSILKPKELPEKSLHLPEPDYSFEKAWAARPEKKNNSMEVPINSPRNLKEKPDVDVFFIHPTTYLSGKLWNSDLENEKVNDRTDSLVLKKQASVFNICCNVYAPRYRQAVIFSFLEGFEKEGEEALDFAYKDVKSAFLYYMKNYNKGRKWVLASHSQGTKHAMRLLKEEIAGTAYLKTMDVAYLIGMPFLEEEIGVKVCESDVEKNCAVGWSTFLWDSTPNRWNEKFTKSICVNPLSWKKNSDIVPKEQHKGYVDNSFQFHSEALTRAKCSGGQLYIDYPGASFPTMGKGRKDYHLVDYSLFYGNIQDNLEKRFRLTK